MLQQYSNKLLKHVQPLKHLLKPTTIQLQMHTVQT